MMGMPTQSFLSDFWQDMLSILGVVGFVLTAIGVWLAYVQICKTASAAKAATDAAIATYNETRSQYKQYIVAQASRLLMGCQAHVLGATWQLAAARVEDLADIILQLADDDPHWIDFIEPLAKIGEQFNRVQLGQIKYTIRLNKEWETLYRGIRLKISENNRPFELRRGVNDG